MAEASAKSFDLRALLNSGWIPAVTVALIAGETVHEAAGVSIADVARFYGYLAAWIVLPGTLAWRLIDRRDRETTSLSEDLLIGSLVGYVLEFPAYLACLAVGHPQWYLAWPIVALTVAAALGRVTHHRCLWSLRTSPDRRLSAVTSWLMAAAIGYLVLWFCRYVWSTTPVTGPGLQHAYSDEPYHLSLAAGLRHFFPAKVLFVDNTPLKYHYLSHLHFAASSWVTGVDPIVLIRALGIPFLFILVSLAAARGAMRLTGATWTGPALLAGLLVVPANQTGWYFEGTGLVDRHLLWSPSAGFVNAALLLGLLLCMELLRGTQAGWPAWCLVTLTFVAMLGAKSASLPTLLVGLWAAAVVVSIHHRQLFKRGLGLATVATVAFVLGKQFFFGSSMQGLTFYPFAITLDTQHQYAALDHTSGFSEFGVHITLAFSYLMGYLTLGIAACSLLVRRGWVQSETIFLLVTCLAGLGAGFSFQQQGGSEGYFIYVIMLPLLLAAVMGLHRVLPKMDRRGNRIVGCSIIFGWAAATIYEVAVPSVRTDAPSRNLFGELVRVVFLPNLGLIVLVAAVTVALCTAWRYVVPQLADGAPVVARALVLPTLALVAAGIGTYVPVHHALVALAKPIESAPTGGTDLIGDGGIQAAEWLESHSNLNDLVATNAHCQFPADRLASRCKTENFWMAGYAERQFLVEGWAYVTRASVGLPSLPNENINSAPFWDPARLALNDAVFESPSVATLGALKQRYGVRWLFVDRRYPVKYRALLNLGSAAPLVYSAGSYAIFEVR